MRQVKRQNPEKTCFLEYDKLYVDHKPYVWNEVNSNIIAIYDIDELLALAEKSNQLKITLIISYEP